jgi:hypothetical protein
VASSMLCSLLLCMSPAFILVSCSAYSNLMMDAVCFSETSVDFTEDSTLHMITYFASSACTQKLCIPLTKKLNSVAVVHKRTILTEQPPLVGEVSANHKVYVIIMLTTVVKICRAIK